MIQQITIVIAVVLSLLTFVLPRRWFLLPFILAACFIPTDQRIILGGLDFTVIRILVVVGVLRLLMRSEPNPIVWHRYDVMILTWSCCGALIYSIQWMQSGAVINRCGILFDILGLYWLFRQSLRNWEDVKRLGLIFAYCSFFLAVLVAIEWTTGRNPFEILGKVVTKVRDGRYRCQASFSHAIMLGLFWATLVPFFIGLAKGQKNKWLYWSATGAATFIVCGTASSTPIATFLYVLVLVPLFPYRRYGKITFYSLCGLLFFLHWIMNAPVWHLIARANIIGGSTGWHRYHLIDEAINHFFEWALLGVRGTAHWGMGLGDVTNQYILEGVRGGLISLILFVVVLVMSVRITCKYSLRSVPRKDQWLGWSICVMVLAHCLSFIGVAYFGQIMLLLYLTLAIVGFVYEKEGLSVRRKRPVAIQRGMARRVPSVLRPVSLNVAPR